MKKLFNLFKVARNSDMIINIVTLALATFGLVMAVSASMTASNNSTTMLVVATIKQFIYLFLGYFLMVFASKLYNHNLAKKLIMPVSLIMIGFLISTRFFQETNGAYAWIRFGFGPMAFTIQPSEFAKGSTTILLAMFLGDIALNTPRSTKEIVQPILVVVLVQAFIILVLQKDMGSALVLLMISFFIALIPSHPKLRKLQNWMIILTVLGILGSIFILSDFGLHMVEKLPFIEPFQLQRFYDYANPFKSVDGYQLSGSLIAFSRGGLFGTGLGQSVQKYGYLPEVRTDFILPLIAEELGFIGVMILMFAYAVLMYRLLHYAMRVRSEKDKMILMGTVFYLFIHVLLNIGGVSGAIPLTGVPLLLISSGGSSTMSIMLMIGICQSVIAKHRRRVAYENS